MFDLLSYLITNRLRPRVFSRLFFKAWLKRIWNFPGLLHIIILRCTYGIAGAKLGPLSIIGSATMNGKAKNLRIGAHSFIASGVVLELHAPIEIGNFVVLNQGVRILTATHDVHSEAWATRRAAVHIGDYAWIAVGALILPGVTIGNGAVVGAGAVVAKDIPEYSVVAGNPARVVGERSRKLMYSPVALSAPYEAWLGSGLAKV